MMIILTLTHLYITTVYMENNTWQTMYHPLSTRDSNGSSRAVRPRDAIGQGVVIQILPCIVFNIFDF